MVRTLSHVGGIGKMDISDLGSSKGACVLRSFLSIASALGFTASALGADIQAVPPDKDGTAFIIIEGEIKAGDADTFRKIAAEYSEAIVLLDSEGGAIGPAMDIGRTIKLREYKTAVYKSGSCASACALIWISGSRRVIFEGGKVGFHASYFDIDGTKLETGVGNALVGHYLSQLGFGEKTVVFATLAPPDKIMWLSDKTAAMSGIDFDIIPKDKSGQPLPAAEKSSPIPPPITIAPAPTPIPLVQSQQDGVVAPGYSKSADNQRWMGEAKQTLRSPEAFAQALRQKGYQATVSYEDPKAPTMSTGVGGEEILVSFSGCNNGDCKYVQFLDYITDATKKESDQLIREASTDELYSHPIWIDKRKILGYYSYLVIGLDGVTINTFIENMRYFVETNEGLTSSMLKARK